MSSKGFKTIDEQLDLLESRGLNISDIQKAYDFLYRNNYYRVSGYSLTLRSHDVFSPSASFQNIIEIYEFDYEMRHILMKYIERIEVVFKSVYAHEFTKVHAPDDYLDPQYFTDSKKHKEIITKAEDQKEKRHKHEAYLKHFIDDLQENLPLWAYVDLLTISDISFIFKISEPSIKTAVSNALGLNMSKGVDLLEHFMHLMTILRNLCAHGSRLFNRLFEQKPNLSKKEKKHLLTNVNGSIDNSHLYGYLFIMKKLLKTEEFSEMKSEIIALTKKYPFVNMKYYGFNQDWMQVL